jgi:uncharacterized cupredoxin-like copper-binding protein
VAGVPLPDQGAGGRRAPKVHNYGEDGHDLAERNSSGRVLGTVPNVRPGRTDTLRVRPRRPGRYTVFCTLEDHEAKGMRARLTVVKRERRRD